MFENEQNFSFKSLFVPLTSLKAIHIIVIVGFIVFFNSLFNNFVWDDFPYVINNPAVHSFKISTIFEQNTFSRQGFFRIIPTIYFSVLYSLFGSVSFLYHSLSLILHIVNVILFFIFLKKWVKKSIALFVSLIFLVHSINVESVTFITASSTSVLPFLFGILALNLSSKDIITSTKLMVIFCLLLLLLLTQEVGILFVVLIVLYRMLFYKSHRLKFFLSSCIIISIYLGMRFSTIGYQLAPYDFVPIARLPLMQRLMHIPQIIFYYFKTFIFPNKLAVSQNWVISTPSLQNFIFPLILELSLFGSILVFAYYIFNRNQKLGKISIFFLVWTVIGFVIISQIIPLDMTVADRWMYFPMVGLLGIIAIGMEYFPIGKNYIKYMSITAAISVLAFFSIRTIVRNTNWQDDKTLLTHDILVQDDYNKEQGLGAIFSNEGKYDEAIMHTKKSIALNPYYANIGQLATIYKKTGDYRSAKLSFLQAISNGQDTHLKTQIYLNYAEFLSLHDNPKKAIDIINQHLLPKYSNISYIWLLLAVANYRIHNQGEALQSIQKAYELSNAPQTVYFYNVVQNNAPIESININYLESY